MPGQLIVTATNGVKWKRDRGATSTPAQLFAAMQLLTADWHQRQWSDLYQQALSPKRKSRGRQMAPRRGDDAEVLQVVRLAGPSHRTP